MLGDYDEQQERILAEAVEEDAAITVPHLLTGASRRNIQKLIPTILPVQGGLPLFYKGKSHAFCGEGGIGKTFIVQLTMLTLTKMLDSVRENAYECPVFVDYEDDENS